MRAGACLVLLLALTACGGDGGGDEKASDQEIAFMVNSDGWGEIWVMERDGANRQRLTDPEPDENDAAGAAFPDWSPDGSKIAYSAQIGLEEDQSLSEIYVMNADGSSEHRLTENVDYDADPAWSPDGARIAFTRVSAIGSERPRGGIVVMNADGTGEKQITRAPDLTLDGTPAWSPDGSRIVFTRGTFQSGSEAPRRGLFVIRSDGGKLDRVSPDAGQASWSPDGGRIVFTSTRDRLGRTCFHECSTNSEIYVMNADGSNQRRLTRSKADDHSPAWSSDGSLIAFVSDRSNPRQHEYEIYVMRSDGGEIRRLTRNKVWDLEPTWRPR